MKGRYTAGLLGALALLTLSACANTIIPFIGGLFALVAGVIGGAIVGAVAARLDDGVKADPHTATGVGALAGLMAGVGAAAGFVLSGLIVGAMFSTVSSTASALDPNFERMLDNIIRQYQTAGMNVDAQTLLDLSSLVVIGAGVCFGVVGVGLVTGAAALAARLSAPSAPAPPYGSAAPADSALPGWGQTPAAPAEPPPPPDASANPSEPDDPERST